MCNSIATWRTTAKFKRKTPLLTTKQCNTLNMNEQINNSVCSECFSYSSNQFSNGPKIAKAFFICSGAQRNFAYTFTLTLPTDLPYMILTICQLESAGYSTLCSPPRLMRSVADTQTQTMQSVTIPSPLAKWQ